MTQVSNTPWEQFPESGYTPQQWRAACLIHITGDPDSKSTHKLPVREPSGVLNRNGVHAAAGRLSQVQDISAGQRRGAARQLINLYHELGEQPPDHLTAMSSRSGTWPDVESRTTQLAVEVRASAAMGGMKVGGYASVFDSLSEPLPGGFREIMSRSMWNKSRGDGWPAVSALYQHREDQVLGTVRAGSLRLNIDDIGLDYEVDLLPSRSDVYESISRGDVSQSSIAMLVHDDSFDWHDGMPLRTLHSGRLLHVSPVTNGAYSQTSASLRSLARHMDASYEEIRSAYADGNLAKFFTRSDRCSGVTALGGRSMTAKQRQLETMAYRWGTPKTPRQEAVEAMRKKSRHEKMLETLAADPDWT